MNNIPESLLFWHLTSFDNMQSILKNGLLSRNKLSELNQKFNDNAPLELIEKRKGNGLDKYVPFHFFPWNPYDKEIFRKYKGQRFCYITIRQELAFNNKKFKISVKIQILMN